MTGKGTMYIVVLSCLLPLSCFAQTYTIPGPDPNNGPTREQKKTIISPQFDFVSGVSRLDRGDRSGLGFSSSVTGLYHLTGALSIKAGLGFARFKSIKRQSDYVPLTDTIHKTSVLFIPLGISFNIGDERAQIITEAYIMPSYYLKEHRAAMGTGIKFGFMIKTTKKLFLGLVGELQFIQPDKNVDILSMRYGFAGAGILVRRNY